MTTDQKLAYFELCVHLVQALYIDQVTDQALRQRAKEQAETVMDSLAADLNTSELKAS